MKHLIIILMTTLALVSGCSDSRPAELYDTAKFEELQNNKEHAAQLYEEIVRNYPETDYAKKAKERLAAITKAPKESPK